MRTKVVVLLVVLLLAGNMGTALGAPQVQGIAVGKISWTRISVCEHPLYPGVFLQYYVTDGCGHELFLYGSLDRTMVGSTIWAEGVLLENGSCKILEIGSLSVCPVPGIWD